MNSPYYILRLDRIDENLPEGRASIQLAFLDDVRDGLHDFADSALKALDQYIAEHAAE